MRRLDSLPEYQIDPPAIDEWEPPPGTCEHGVDWDDDCGDCREEDA